jgi:hypothetical protein
VLPALESSEMPDEHVDNVRSERLGDVSDAHVDEVGEEEQLFFAQSDLGFQLAASLDCFGCYERPVNLLMERLDEDLSGVLEVLTGVTVSKVLEIKFGQGVEVLLDRRQSGDQLFSQTSDVIGTRQFQDS